MGARLKHLPSRVHQQGAGSEAGQPGLEADVCCWSCMWRPAPRHGRVMLILLRLGHFCSEAEAYCNDVQDTVPGALVLLLLVTAMPEGPQIPTATATPGWPGRVQR